MTYFEVFSLPPKLGLDTAALEKTFYRLSREFHPDRFASKPADEQAAATEKSSLLNDAYRTLRDPIRRTEYLLHTQGVEMEEQSVKATESARSTGTEKKQIVPPDLLEEAFELNMQLEEMKMAKAGGDDDPQLRKDLEAAKANFAGLLEASQKQLEAEWTSWDAAVDIGDDGAKDAAKDEMLALAEQTVVPAQPGARREHSPRTLNRFTGIRLSLLTAIGQSGGMDSSYRIDRSW